MSLSLRFIAKASAFLLVILFSPVNANALSGERGGPCGGASAPPLQVHVHVVGKQSQASMKLIGHFELDEDGLIIGELVVGQGKRQIRVTSWCRIWISNSVSKHSSATHVLGVSTMPDGREMLIRVDLRDEDGGKVRVRVRSISGSNSHSTQVDEDSDEGWKSVTGEGWLSTTRLQVNSLT